MRNRQAFTVHLRKRTAEDERKRLQPKGERIADTNLHFAGSGGGPADRNENARHSRLFAEA
ncbi:hypothetical protein N0B30_22940 [Bacillus subtilis]|nr:MULTISPECIES: hypothetical protein [Bacillus subtilis group]MCT6515490.1 hypothetical protein [Bacillus subtilis]